MKAYAIPFLALLSTLPALADAPSFCTDAFSFVCGANAATKTERDARVETFKTSLKPDELAALEEKEAETVRSYAPAVKELLKGAIEEQAIAGLITPDTRDKMKARIDETQIYTRKDLEGEHKDVDDKWKVLISHVELLGYMMTCSPDGLAENAYSSIRSGKPFVLLCPGWLLRGTSDNPQLEFFNILQVLAHELGHKIDAGEFPEVFPKYSACLTTKHRDLLAYGKEWYDQLIASMPPELGLFKDAYRVQRHLKEITADFWSAQTVRRYLATLEAPARGEVIRKAWAGLCDSGDEGIHPDNHYRLEILLQGDPGIRTLMGCEATPAESCALSGN